jgi:uncharacterized membrane protein
MTMDGQMGVMKNWYHSKAIWGSLIAVAASVLQVVGIDMSAEDQASLAEIAVTLVAAAGGLLALYGRLVASVPIGRAEAG